MTNLTRLKLLVGGAGIAIWGWGVRMGDDRYKWVGVALLAGAFLLRFVNRRERL